MTAALIPFEFDGVPVRVVILDGEPCWVGRDVAERLGYADPTNAMKQHCRGVVKRHPIVDALGRTQEARILSEPDVLRLIVSSKLPDAERFERWIFEEVLPSIRRTGGYTIAARPPDFDDPAVLQGLLLTHLEANKKLKAENEALLPKAAALDRIATASHGALCVTDAAKALQVRPKDLFDFLKSHGWIYRRAGGKHWLGYQPKILSGLLEHKVTTQVQADGSERMFEQLLITPKGLERLATVLGPPLLRLASDNPRAA